MALFLRAQLMYFSSPFSVLLFLWKHYTQAQVLLPEIKAMIAAGKTQREIAEHFGFTSKKVVKELLFRERRKEREIQAGILPRPKGRPKKDAPQPDLIAAQHYEIARLKMENELLRNFLQVSGRGRNHR